MKNNINKEIYCKLQNQSGINPGDYVKVITSCEDFYFGWDNSWANTMDNFLGGIFQVQKTDYPPEYGIQLTLDGEYIYGFPFFCLEKVTNPFKELKLKDVYSFEEITFKTSKDSPVIQIESHWCSLALDKEQFSKIKDFI